MVQQFTDVFLKTFSVLSIFIDFTDEAGLSVGESVPTIACHFIAVLSC